MADLITSAEATAAWPGFAALAAAEQSALLSAASRAIEQECGRIFEQGSVTESISGTGSNKIWLGRPPVASITSVTVDGQELDNTDLDAWSLDPETGALQRGDGRDDPALGPWWPRGFRNITVIYTGGYAVIPADIKRAALVQLRALVDGTAHSGVLSSEKLGDYQYTLGSMGATIAPLARALARPYRLA